MPIPTIDVTVNLFEIVGSGLPHARVVFNLTRPDIVVGVEGGIVPKGQEVLTVDETGQGVISLFPNALGANGTQYGVQVYDADGVQVFPETVGKYALTHLPDSDCLLHSVLHNVPPISVDDAQAAILAAQAAIAVAEEQALIATEQAGIATTKAGEAAGSAAAADESAVIASDAAVIAVDAVSQIGTSVEDAEAAALSINQRIYSGVYATPPTTRPPEGAGSAMQEGDEYQSSTGQRYFRAGGAWVAYVAAGIEQAQSFSAIGVNNWTLARPGNAPVYKVTKAAVDGRMLENLDTQFNIVNTLGVGTVIYNLVAFLPGSKRITFWFIA